MHDWRHPFIGRHSRSIHVKHSYIVLFAVCRDHMAYRSAYWPVKDTVDGDLCAQFPSVSVDVGVGEGCMCVCACMPVCERVLRAECWWL